MRKWLLMMLGVVLFTGQLLAQQRTISGKVTDETGAPVANASVLVKGTNVGTVTNNDGSYSLQVPASGTTLVFTSVNRTPVEVPIGSSTVVNAELLLSFSDLEAVVVTVPYGTVKKTAFTGSESTVTSRTLQNLQVTSVTKALEGLVPGIITTNGGGAPGSGAAVLIRGVGSVNASSSPLYVLDGAVYNGSIAALSMDDIESVTILKDAAATALYGARAANGVIMMTTKKGRAGKTNVTATVRQGFMSRGIPEYDRVNSQEYYELMWEAARNSYFYAPNSTLTMAQAGQQASNVVGGPNGLVYNPFSVPANQVIDPATGKLNPNAQLLWEDSWEDALIRKHAPRTNVNLSISNASEASDYLFSLGYLNEEGTAKFSGYKRYNARLNVNARATKWLNAGLSIDGALADQANVPSGGTATTNPFYYTRNMGPIYPVWQRDASGNFITDPATGERQLDWGRPDQMGTRPYAGNSNLLGSLALDDRSSKINNANANTYVEIKFLRDFTFRTNLAATYYNAFGTTYQNSQFGDADNVSGRSTKSDNRQITYTLNEVLTWNKEFGDHSLRLLAGHENYSFTQNFVSATRTGFPFPGTSELAPAATAEGSTSFENKHRIEGYFTNANYSFQDKYLLSASFRRDGTSRFFKDIRWGNFYSVGAGWRISQESFMDNVRWINELKLKASYGEQGNESVSSYYAWQSLYDLGWNNVDFPGAQIGSLSNETLLWEKNAVLNVGADFSLFDNRLQGNIEYFERTSQDLIFPYPLAPSTGFESINRNIGTLKNTGVELQLGYNIIRKRDFDWRADVNFTHFKNKFTKLPFEDMPQSGITKYRLGGSIYEFYIREYAGVDASTGDALFYRDILGSDGKPTGERELTNNINNASYYYHGDALPDFNGGVSNSFRYKSFDLSFLVTFSVGGEFYDGNYLSLMHPGSYGSHWHRDILQRWQKPGDVTNVPRLHNGIATQNGISTRYLFDGSWANLKNITLGYSLPANVSNRIGIQGIKVFANVDNAYLFTTRKGMDPQRSFGGTSDWSYPPFRTVTFGTTINL